ncbi:SDR family oxidoreductase [Flavihumibacter fluvii]|uniref:SDR family oxidoreductase n=1 Tax=Flavihumibacter fluvii TaxID=2838157 RepID=UPI001BDECDBE|nr:SDR family oxidoreductase [Flavihumibacter fluvii]ULQ52767.1 SDR family oxidoreductase [Flavihumibacter fluvii]
MPVVLILGATSDIGVAIAKKFAAEKYGVILASRNPEQLSPLKSDLAIRFGIDCYSCQFDAMDFGSHQNFYQSLPVKPDIAICIFGYMKDNEFVSAHPDELVRTIGTNFTGAASILNIIARDFSKRKSGTIVGISSVAGLRGRQSNYIYGSAKAGFIAYLSGLRNRLFRDQVHVLTVLPGFVNTSMTEDLQLPPLLTAQPVEVAVALYKGVSKKKNTIYVKWFWKWIMLIIKMIPEPIFKKLRL